jgi:hypothetical protein
VAVVKGRAEQSNSDKVDACDGKAGEQRRGLVLIGDPTGLIEICEESKIAIKSARKGGAVAAIVGVTGICEVGGSEGVRDEVARIG